MATRFKVLLADDSLIAREGWKRIFETVDNIEVVGEATAISEIQELLTSLKPDFLITDLSWFGDQSAGWSIVKEIKLKFRVKVIAVTAFETLIRDARRAGADSALLKNFTREQLINEIRELAS